MAGPALYALFARLGIFLLNRVTCSNLFTVVSPFISGDISTCVWTIIDPLLFVVIAMRFKIKQEDVH
ncbi:MAG: hypothetical protein ACRAUW_02380 [Aeromonas sp.]|uniref:hypothetical protein n=1 Tax=Aeromonas sp. TaxID=647 RepID=UPI003D6ADC2B